MRAESREKITHLARAAVAAAIALATAACGQPEAAPPASAPAPVKAGLRAELIAEDRVVDGDKGPVVRFVLHNETDTPIRIWKRWCSWGAFCWSFEARRADGRLFEIAHPSPAFWTSNFPDPVDIAPHSAMTSEFHPFARSPVQEADYDCNGWQWRNTNDDAAKEPPLVPGALRLRGRFSLRRDPRAEHIAPFANTYFNEEDRARIAATERATWEGDLVTSDLTFDVKRR